MSKRKTLTASYPRVGDDQISAIIRNQESYAVVTVKMAFEIRDSRARIAELERLSASQEEAHELRDGGAKL